MIQISSTALHDTLALPENYTIVGATCNLLYPQTIGLLVEVSGEEFKSGTIPVPVYQREEIDGKSYIRLDHMDSWPQPLYPATDLVILPRWLVNPENGRLPRTVKPFYVNLLYRSMEIGREKLELSSKEMQSLAQGLQQEEVKRYLNLLRTKKLVRSWSSEGLPPRVQKWNVELVPGGALNSHE
jgi:hypothetical protein